MHHPHFQTADRISNTYNIQTDTQVNEALRLLGKPKGCSWDPSRACLDGTRVIHIEAILSWASSLEAEPTTTGAQILLVPGPAGSGKSALAHTICEQLNKKGLLVCSIFFDHTGQQPTAEDFTVALIRGLCAISDPVKKAIAEIIIQNETLASASALRQVKDIVLPILPKLPANRNFVVGIDALDEQPNPTTLRLLQDHVPHLPPTFRFILTTRPDRRVMQYLENRPHIISFPHRLVGNGNDTDVKIFITFRLSQTDYSNTISHKLLAAFIAKSEGLFLWAETVLNHIDNAFEHAAELADILAGASSYWMEAETAAAKLEKLYGHILLKLEWKDPRFVKKYTIIVGALVTVREPLSRRGLAGLYSPDGITEDDVHGICMLLRTLLKDYSKDDPTQPIHLLHLSVQEYLVQRAPQPFRIDCEVHHKSLSRLCLLAIQRELTPAKVPILGYSDGDWAWDVTEKNREIPVLLRASLTEPLWYSIQHFNAHWRSLREEAGKEHTTLLREIVVENPRPILEVAASTRSKVDIISLQHKVWPHGPLGIALARRTAKIYVSLGRCLSRAKRDAEALALLQGAVGLYTPYKDNNLDTTVELELTTSLTWLGVCLYELDRPDDALPHVEEAVTICRQLSLACANEALVALAHSLEAKGYVLDKLKRYDEAYDIDMEVLDLYRQLVVGHPEKFQHQLGLALGNLAWSLDACKKHEEAVVVIQEEVELCRKMMERDTQISGAGLIMSLESQARYLNNVGRTPEAVECSREAVKIHRRLMYDDPEKFNAGLANSLHNLVSHLDNCGRVAEAIPFSCEAIEIRRQLAANDPSTFEPDLAHSLHNHALYTRKAGRITEAVGYVQDAVEIRRRLVHDDPEKFSAVLAASLHNLASDLYNCGRVAEAIPYSCEAIEIRRQLVANDPSTFEPDLADSLYNHALYTRKAGRITAAVGYGQDAVEIRRRLVHDNPEKFNADLANSLHNLASHLNNCGRVADAIPYSCEAIEIRRQLAANDPSTFEPGLSSSLHNYALYTRNSGRITEAVGYGQDAMEIRRRLVHDDPEKFNTGLASSLHNLASDLNDCGRVADAIPLSFEAIEIRRQLVENHPSTFEPKLASSLHNHALYTRKAGRITEAVRYGQYAVEIRRRLVHDNPENCNADLAESLYALALDLYNCGRVADAIPLSCEAIEIYRQLVANDPATFEPKLADSLQNNAIYLQGVGRTEEALERRRERDDIRSKLPAQS
ncbi:TPR-like protein [Coprinopsis marcescibilis]|uniref:TPR-like protein n=1 Tax=Coprinopsis marcescibilis TaxID=230819 RepID=A0A5C3KDA9_COPMA|nr:TPR-like protein [Coprinopsis marcescibilis]